MNIDILVTREVINIFFKKADEVMRANKYSKTFNYRQIHKSFSTFTLACFHTICHSKIKIYESGGYCI